MFNIGSTFREGIQFDVIIGHQSTIILHNLDTFDHFESIHCLITFELEILRRLIIKTKVEFRNKREFDPALYIENSFR